MQLGLMDLAPDLLGFRRGMRMPRVAQEYAEVLDGSVLNSGQRWVVLEKAYGDGLRHVAKQGEGHGVRGFERSTDLVYQPCLRVDESILIARQLLEFLDHRGIWLQALEHLQVA